MVISKLWRYVGVSLQKMAPADAAGVTGIVLTKLDGTAKGGVVVAISRELGLQVRFVGVGEKAGDLLPFDAKEFVDSLFA